MIVEVLRKITPNGVEKKAIEKTGKKLIKLLERELKKTIKDVSVDIFGSVSRDTWLAHEKDIDVFVKFPPSYTKKQLEDVVTSVGKRILKNVEKRFAEHPYVRGEYNGYSVEIIPCYTVEDAAKRLSAVDRTPFHDKFVRSNLRGRQDEVRLLKQFLKGIGCYGAEAKVEGFSGYLCELLVIHYGSFEEVLKAAVKWQAPVVIDMKRHQNVAQGFFSPLIFIDPTDRERNVASALSQHNLSLFVYAAKEFLKSPKESFFFPSSRAVTKEKVLELFRLRNMRLLSITFQSPDVIEDILYPQLRKTVRFLERLLTDAGFSVVNSGFFIGQKITVAFELPAIELPDAMLHAGPPVNSKNEDEFLSKHRGSERALTSPFIRGDRWMVFLKREHKAAGEFIESFLSKKDLKKKGIPSYIAEELEKRFSVKIDEEGIKDGLGFF
ncbi:MAG: CCA tRNA nucleotidyltransferase, partial [Candidatus Hydrothermarchaeales archaeon]